MAAVLVVKLGALGDLLLADGALRDLRRHHPHDRITLLTRRPFATMMARCPWIDGVLVDDNAPRWQLPRMWALARRLRAPAFERGYDLQNSRRSGFYRRRLLPSAAWSSGECVSGRKNAVPVLQRLAAQLSDAGVATVHVHAPDPAWLAEPLPAAVGAQLVGPYVVLLPGASARHPGKRWPGYAELAELLRRDGTQVVTVPGPDEIGERAAMPGMVLLDGDRPLGVPYLASVLLGARFVVGNDSGPTHLAAHLGCRGLALFGGHGATPEQTGILRPGFGALAATPIASLRAAEVHEAIRASM